MSTKPNNVVPLRPQGQCVHPDIGELLPDYLVGLLSEAAAEEVEQHLLACVRCHENYLKVCRLKEAARRRAAETRARAAAANGHGRMPTDAAGED